MKIVEPDYDCIMDKLCEDCPYTVTWEDLSKESPDDVTCPAGQPGDGLVLWSTYHAGFYCDEREAQNG